MSSSGRWFKLRAILCVDFSSFLEQLLLRRRGILPVKLIPLTAYLAQVDIRVYFIGNASEVFQRMKFLFGCYTRISRESLLFDSMMNDHLSFEFRVGLEKRGAVTCGYCLSKRCFTL